MRSKGFLQIDEYETIRNCDAKIDGINCLLWFRLHEKEFLFKCGTYEECYSEVFWGYVLNHLKLENVHYDLAKLNGLYGVITENCNYQNRPSISLRDLLKNYCKKNNLDDIVKKNDNLTFTKKVYDNMFENKYTSNAIVNLKEDTFLHFIIQILLGNSDLNRGNMKLFLDTLSLYPFYDFGRYGRVRLKWYENKEFLYSYKEKEGFENSRKIFQNFLNHASKKEIELYKEYMYTIIELKTRNIFEEMENDISNKIDQKLKRTLKRQLKQNAIKSKKIIQKNQL